VGEDIALPLYLTPTCADLRRIIYDGYGIFYVVRGTPLAHPCPEPGRSGSYPGRWA
jgi:hypothetical protein